MSLIALLAAQHSGGAPPAPDDPRPAPLDDVIAALRPTGRLIWAATVAQDGTGDYDDLHEAEDAAWAAWRAQLAAEGLREDQATPNYRTQIIVKPGVYETVNLKMPLWGELIRYGQDQVTITTPTDEPRLAQYAVNIQSRFYCEGVTILKPPGVGRYAVHNASGGTTIWADVGMYWETPQPWPHVNGRPSGLDGGNGLTVCWYRCATNGLTNSHGWDTNTIPATHLFIHHEGGTVGYRSGNGGSGLTADETWVVGGNVHQVSVSGPNAILHLDPSTAAANPLSVGAGVTVDDRTDWPIPWGGMSAADRAAFGM